MSSGSANVISSSIIVLTAAALILGGAFIQHSDSKLFIQFVGSAMGIIGMSGWIISFKDNREFMEKD